ncbi:MAG: class I SAM-dependent methyltransferase [Candidatus Kapaibacterium sp.]|nr:MAG: class I SAM-dependent methyltransferase [Candidatus Kapabacteria bacterium]
MLRAAYIRFKQLLPRSVRNALSRVNQGLFARRTIERKYGTWFDVDWRKKFRTMPDADWIAAYDAVWQHHHNNCTDETDAAMIITALGGAPHHDSTEQDAKKNAHVQNAHVQSVLEVGCGAGSLAIAMAQAGFRVTCVDVSSEALRKAAHRAQTLAVQGEQTIKHDITWKQGFAEALPFPDKSFDAITCCHTLEHVRDLQTTVQELKRVARMRIVVVVPRQEYRLYAENYHTQFFSTPDQLSSAFGLPRSETRELNYVGRDNEFQDEALLYIGYVE